MLLHPIISTLHRVHAYLRHLPDGEMRRLADAVGLSSRALRHARGENWEPKPSTLAALDTIISERERSLLEDKLGTTVPAGKAQFGANATHLLAAPAIEGGE